MKNHMILTIKWAKNLHRIQVTTNLDRRQNQYSKKSKLEKTNSFCAKNQTQNFNKTIQN